MNVYDITAGDLLCITGELERLHDSEYVGSKGYELRKVDVMTPGGRLFQFEFFGRDIPQDVESFKNGDKVKVEFFVQQREYNGRVFTKLSGKSIDRADGAQAQAPATEAEDSGSEMPF